MAQLLLLLPALLPLPLLCALLLQQWSQVQHQRAQHGRSKPDRTRPSDAALLFPLCNVASFLQRWRLNTCQAGTLFPVLSAVLS